MGNVGFMGGACSKASICSTIESLNMFSMVLVHDRE